MEGLEMTCFQIISSVGTARSNYIEAVRKARVGDFEGAEACIVSGQQEFLKGMRLILNCCRRRPTESR